MDNTFNNSEDSKDNSKIQEFFYSNKNCIICAQEIQNGDKINITEKRDIIKEESKDIIPCHNAATKIMLTRMGYLTFENPFREEIKNRTEICKEESAISAYFDFLSCIDLTNSKSSFKSFNLNIFNSFSKYNFKGEVFQNFIRKLLDDPLLYSKEDKLKILYILILLYTNITKTEKLVAKIKQLSFLFKPRTMFDVTFRNDPLISNFLIQMRKYTFDLSEAIFLNNIYLNVKNNKDVFNLFHKRLMDTIIEIESKNLFSFLKHVFTHKTVLFMCITDIQLIQLIISFYKSMLKLENTFSILEYFYDSIYDEEINMLVLKEIQNINLKRSKVKKKILEIEIKNFVKLDKFYTFMDEHKDSFDGLSLLLAELKNIQYTLKEENDITKLILIFLYFYGILKTEFVENLLNHVLNSLIFLINKIETFNDEFYIFNYKSWNAFSNIILATQKIDLEADEIKKKKGCRSKINNETSKLGEKLANILYKLEEKFVGHSDRPILKFKKRGYKYN